MNVSRTIEAVADGNYCVGDVITFALTDGEPVKAMAMKQTDKGMLFLFVDCLKDEYPMNEEDSNRGGYDASDLKAKLNGEILERFPAGIRDRMVAFDNGDMLRLPTEKEIFGKNEYGEDEPDTVEQFEPMKERRNRIAFQGLEGAWEWYWLQNKVKRSAAAFAGVNGYGYANCYGASSSFGVRPAFLLS